MKKIFISLAALAAMVGCSEIDEQSQNVNMEAKESISLQASIEVENDTRVTVDGEKFTEVNWVKGDVISLVSELGTSAKLAAEASGKSDICFVGESSPLQDVDTYYAVYPALDIEGATVTFNYAEQSGDDVAALVAKSENAPKGDLHMAFKPVNALLHVAVSGVETLAKAEFVSYNGATLPASFTYNFATDTTENGGSVEAYAVTAPAADGFFFRLPANLDMSNGYIVRLTDIEGNVCSKAYNGKTFTRGTTTRVEIAWSTPTVTLGTPMTSYSYYAAGDTATANNCANNVIYFTSASTYANVQSAMVAEAGFIVDGTTYAATIDTASKSFSMGNVTVASWGAKSVEAYIKTKDGITYKSAQQTVYITGLPYHADWRSADYGDWKYTNISDKGAMLQVDGASGWNTSKLGCIISPVFNIPSGSISVRPSIAASTNATSVGGYTTSYAYVGNRSSSAEEKGASTTIGYTSDFEGNLPDTPLSTYNSTLSLTTSNPCVVMTAKDFRISCNTYIFQAKIEYAK